MAFKPEQLAGLVFKKIATGKSTAAPEKQFFEEPKSGRPFVSQDQIWKDSDLIPDTAPAQSEGVVVRVSDLALIPVPGASGSFFHPNLKDTIPFNWGDGTSYNYTLTDSASAAIPFGMSDWYLDTETGVLTFFGGVPAGLAMPPRLSCWTYAGRKGIVIDAMVTSVNGATGDVEAVNSLNGLTGHVKIDSDSLVLVQASGATDTLMLDLDPSKVVGSINGNGGFIDLVGAQGVAVTTTQTASGTRIIIKPDGAGGLNYHTHDGVNSPRVDWFNLLNKPIFVSRLNDFDGVVKLKGGNNIVVYPDSSDGQQNLVIEAQNLATANQLATHNHDGVGSQRVSFTNLINLPRLVNTFNGASGDVTLVGLDARVTVAAASANPQIIEIGLLDVATEDHTHAGEYVEAVNGVTGMPVVVGGDSSIIVQVSGNQIKLFATGVEGQYAGSGMPAPHAALHASGGDDAISPLLIGAADRDHDHGNTYAPFDHTHANYSPVGHEHDVVNGLNGLKGDLTIEAASGSGITVTEGPSGTIILDTAGLSASAAPHASQHHYVTGSDPLTAADVGAAPLGHTHGYQHLPENLVWTLNGYNKRVEIVSEHGVSITESSSGDLTTIAFAVTGDGAVMHADNHKLGGSDPLLPEDIGAASVGHVHDDRYSSKTHLHDARYSQLGHTHVEYASAGHDHDEDYAPKEHSHADESITMLNGMVGRVQVIAGTNVSISTSAAPSGSAYDYVLKIDAKGGGGSGDGGSVIGSAQAYTDQFTASGGQAEFTLTQWADTKNPIRLTVANVRQPIENYTYDEQTKILKLNGWSCLDKDLIFVDYFYV